MQIKKEEELFCKRLLELAGAAYQKGICTYSDFLNLNEINLFYYMKSELPPIQTDLFGGHPEAERQVICFYNKDSFSKPEYPIQCIHIKPLNQKFSDVLTHRDFLGALIHLGIDRSKLGDILIKENECYLFSNNRISEFIVDNLVKIKHTNISCDIVNLIEVDYTPKYIEMTGTVASLRLDAILSLAFKSSRSSIIGLIEGGKVFVNSRLILSNSHILKEDDIVSVRGYGKFIYKETYNKTKKGRFLVTLLKYS